MAVKGVPLTITFTGTNVQQGDFAKWVQFSDTATSCDASLVAPYSSLEFISASSSAEFVFGLHGIAMLCYRWNLELNAYYSGAADFAPLQEINALVVEVLSVTHPSTGIQCESSIRIGGRSFPLIDWLDITCKFIDNENAGNVMKIAAYLVSDTAIQCASPIQRQGHPHP